jgi:WD40 repeat protein
VGQTMQHEGAVTSAQFSPDGRWVVTASKDYTARVWDATTGRAVGEPMKHGGVVHSAQFSPDGRRVVTTSEDNTARLSDVGHPDAGSCWPRATAVMPPWMSEIRLCAIVRNWRNLKRAGEGQKVDAGGRHSKPTRGRDFHKSCPTLRRIRCAYGSTNACT